MNIQIGEMRPEHVEAVQDVLYRTWLETYPNVEVGITVEDIEERWKDRNSEERLSRRKSELQKKDSHRKQIVATADGEVVGVSIATQSDTANRLNAMYVFPEYQGNGIGMTLWNEIQKFFDPAKDIVVGVATYNTRAIRFYSKLGFVDSGRRYTDDRFQMKSGALIPEMDLVIRAQ
jgi:ribosomal protein S18 acetylase RimI-like enzyme